MNKQKIIKNVFSSLISQFITIIYGFIVPILIIKTYGSETNGLVNSITQFIAYIVLLEAGIGPIIKNALYKPIVEKNKEEIEEILGASNKFFNRIAYALIIYCILLCIFYPIINNQFSFIYTISLILIISISRFAEYFLGMTYKLFLQSEQKNYVIDYINALGYIINLIIIIVLIKLNFNIQIVKLISSIVFVIKPITFKIYFDKKYGYNINKKSKFKFAKQWDGLAHHIAATVQSNTDVMILTIFSNLSNVSIYSVYYLVTNGIRAIIVSLTNGIDAFFGKLMIEDENKINNKFSMYSFCFYTIATILLSSTLVLIIPFVSVYTKNVTDANYIQPLFAYFMVFAEFNFVIRYPFSTLVYAKGHFKETRNFSIIEPIVNIIISSILVFKFGLIGVAIGTTVSVLIRSMGFIIYASKNILNAKLKDTMKIILLSTLELVIFFFIHLLIGNIRVENYIQWFIMAIISFIIIAIVVLTINCMCYKNLVKKFLWKVRNKNE